MNVTGAVLRVQGQAASLLPLELLDADEPASPLPVLDVLVLAES